MSLHRRCKSRDFQKLPPVKTTSLLAQEVKVRDLKAKNINACNIKTEDIEVAGVNLTCMLRAPTTIVGNAPFDCMDCEVTPEYPYGQPIKPDFLEQDVWDFLMCNLKSYREQLEHDFLVGREQIRCIKQAYGCEICPPDCPVPLDCICPDAPNCEIPEHCKPDPLTCEQRVITQLYATQTIPPYFYSCGVGTTGPTGTNQPSLIPGPLSRLNFVNDMSFNLNINNLTCTISPRVATVMVQAVYKGVPLPPPNPSSCPTCPNRQPQDPLVCLCEQNAGPDINCNIVNVMCKQFAATININLGENFNGNIALSTELIYAMYEYTKQYTNGVIPAALQLVIFLEEGLQVSANGTRKAGDGSDGSSTSQKASSVPVPNA